MVMEERSSRRRSPCRSCGPYATGDPRPLLPAPARCEQQTGKHLSGHRCPFSG